MATPTITVDGKITRIRQFETRKGVIFLRVRVASPEMHIDVDIFSREHRRLLDNALPGDRLRASGTGYNRGSIRNGRTSITARSVNHEADLPSRAARKHPQQLSLFA